MAGASAETGIPEAAVRALAAGVDLLCLGSATSEDTFEAVHAAVVAAVHAGRLPEDRVAEAASRVRALAATTAGRMPAPAPHRGHHRTLPDATVAGAFRIDGRATAWLAAPGPVAFVQVASTANLAVGDVSWGPAALGATVAEADVPPGARVAVVGRAVDASHPATAAVQRLRGQGPRRRARRVRLAARRCRHRDLRRLSRRGARPGRPVSW